MRHLCFSSDRARFFTDLMVLRYFFVLGCCLLGLSLGAGREEEEEAFCGVSERRHMVLDPYHRITVSPYNRLGCRSGRIPVHENARAPSLSLSLSSVASGPAVSPSCQSVSHSVHSTRRRRSWSTRFFFLRRLLDASWTTRRGDHPQTSSRRSLRGDTRGRQGNNAGSRMDPAA